MPENYSTHQHWMREAILEAQKAALLGEVPVGAVLIQDGQLLGRAHNTPISSNDPSAHAEMNVIRQVAKQVNNYRLPGMSLYVTLEPCLMCAGAMFHARLNEVYFGAYDPKTGTAGSVINIFDTHQLNHHTKVYGGILEQECANLLKDFFKARRTN